MLTMTMHKNYKTLAYMITEKAKQTGRMKRYDYEHTVKPFQTMLRESPITEQQLLSGLYRAHVTIVK